jgi:hypothetical protein
MSQDLQRDFQRNVAISVRLGARSVAGESDGETLDKDHLASSRETVINVAEMRKEEGKKISFGAEAYNLFNHPNFAVPSNTQSPLTLGGTETPSSEMQRSFRQQRRSNIYDRRNWPSDSSGRAVHALRSGA